MLCGTTSPEIETMDEVCATSNHPSIRKRIAWGVSCSAIGIVLGLGMPFLMALFPFIFRPNAGVQGDWTAINYVLLSIASCHTVLGPSCQEPWSRWRIRHWVIVKPCSESHQARTQQRQVQSDHSATDGTGSDSHRCCSSSRARLHRRCWLQLLNAVL